MNKAFIIFSGYNTRAVAAFCRKLDELKAPFYIIASGKEDFIFSTVYKKRVAAIRNNKKLIWDDLAGTLAALRRQAEQERFVLCPSSEYLNQFALHHRRELDELGLDIPLVELETYELITNKLSFSSYCREQGLETPRRLESADTRNIPFVAKPKENVCDERTLYPYLIMNDKEYRFFLQQENTQNFYFEEFIDGAESYYLLFYISPFGGELSFSQNNILQQAGGKSIVAAQPAQIHLEKIGHEYLILLQQAGFWGLIMIELKKKAQRYIMIEANPRLWGPSQLFVDNGVPFFEAFIFENSYHRKYNLNTKTFVNKNKPYLWLGGIWQNKLNGRPLVRHVSRGGTALVMRAVLHDVYLRRDTWPYFFKELFIHKSI